MKLGLKLLVTEIMPRQRQKVYFLQGDDKILKKKKKKEKEGLKDAT